MGQLGLKPVLECPCLFTNTELIVFFFVDDIVVLFHPSNRTAYDNFKQRLMAKLILREIGELRWFLGIRIVRDRTQRKVWLCQDSYLADVYNTFRLDGKYGNYHVPIPTEPLEPYEGQADIINKFNY